MSQSIRTLITAAEIETKIHDLAQRIYRDYVAQGRSLTLLGILKGGFLFCADLAREISRVSAVEHGICDPNDNGDKGGDKGDKASEPQIEIEFLSVKSYEGQTSTLTEGGELRIELDTRNPIEGKHVLIIEDIIDTGLSMNMLCDRLRARRPASLSICTLLSKPSRRVVSVPIDYCGFEIEDKFVIGYGMDYDERYRELPYIGYLE